MLQSTLIKTENPICPRKQTDLGGSIPDTLDRVLHNNDTRGEVIGDFEIASGARLNLQKSIVMALRPGSTPGWIEETGCEVARIGRNFLYLGVSTSSPIDERAIANEIVQKMMKKLKHWSNKLLSWPAKTLLLKHVLAATPLYQLMSVGLSKDGLEELERLCRNFLWGWNEEGNPKQALIAWDRVALPKAEGGLGWTKFKVMADALNVRQVSRIIEGGCAEWIQLARSFILRTLRRGSYQRECSQWTVQEGLILLPLTRIEGSPTLTRMLNSWYRARKKLHWKGGSSELNGNLTMLQLTAMHQITSKVGVSGLKPGKELGILRKAHIDNFGDARSIIQRGGWTRHLQFRGIFPEEETRHRLQLLEDWCQSHRAVVKDLPDLEGWRWMGSTGQFSWSKTTQEWRKLLFHGSDITDIMEDKWNHQSLILTWKQRWKLLWEAPIHHRRRVWLWRILQRGLFTNSRAAEMGHQDGNCKRCISLEESLEHILWDCRKTVGRRGKLVELTEAGRRVSNILEWIDTGLLKSQFNPASILVCILYCWSTWRERNEWQFQHKHTHRPIGNILKEVEEEIIVLKSGYSSDVRRQALDRASEDIQSWRIRWANQQRA
ncbi:hypothetical protein R1sor_020799 [Riccia sorocarpa]|uniref:Reverse transcriptase zinc-binding domain-containing protein n=1 Tax=Riccia sorocarpa TaxID=122646 RepID=A0ABD3GFZ3_9MARC